MPIDNIKDNTKEYTTDGKVRHLSQEDDINVKIGKILGKKFVDYRKKWDAVNRMEILTEFPMFLQLDMNQGSEYGCPSLSPQGNNEPFLIKDLHKYIEYAHNKGFIDIMLNNNGSAMPKKKLSKFSTQD